MLVIADSFLPFTRGKVSRYVKVLQRFCQNERCGMLAYASLPSAVGCKEGITDQLSRVSLVFSQGAEGTLNVLGDKGHRVGRPVVR